jgi:pimeloyl-ACP methyl ester carboxylesterase
VSGRPTKRRVTTNGIQLDVIDAGDQHNPVVVLAHGFPESSHSWRHQIEPLVEAGYRVVVPDQRGYGASSKPSEVADYRVDHLCADLVGLLDNIGADEALFVGHDWGALVVWDLARLHPDRVRGLVNVSVPYTAWPAPPTDLMKAMWTDRFFYILYFQEVGPAEAELERDIALSLRSTLWGGSAEMFAPMPEEFPPMEGTGFLDSITRGKPVRDGLPDWINADEFSVYVDQFETSGFFGPLSWYRNLDADYELIKDLPAPAVPTAFIGGTKDGVIAHRPEYVDAMRGALPDFRGTRMIDDAGHWTQQEKPAEFNAALLDLLAELCQPTFAAHSRLRRGFGVI